MIVKVEVQIPDIKSAECSYLVTFQWVYLRADEQQRENWVMANLGLK